MTTPALSSSAQLRLATIRADISGRLWSINAGMTSSVFNGLMDQMALLQYNCEQRVIVEGSAERRSGHLDRRSPAKEFLVRTVEPPVEPHIDKH